MNRTPNQTVRISAALAWEFWAHGWPGILLAPWGAVVLPSFIFGMMTWEYGTPVHDSEAGNLLEFSFYWITLVLLGAPVFTALGNPARAMRSRLELCVGCRADGLCHGDRIC